MTAASRKAFRDAWQERRRSVSVIATIAAGVAALLTLLGSYAILTRELNSGYLSTNPASAILHTDAIDEQSLALVRTDPEVAAVEARHTVLARIKTGPAQWHNLALFVVPSFTDLRLNKFLPEEGAWPPATGEVLIERDAMLVAHAKVGDSITFRTEGGELRTLRVSGRVHDVGQPQARMENTVYGYISVPTLAGIGEKPTLDLLLIQVAGDKYNEGHIRQVANQVKLQLEANGHPVKAIDFPVPGKHPHADLMGGLLLAISSFGVFLLVLSGVLALNFIAALMAAQVRQIGIMKAIGGTGWRVAYIYVAQSLLLGCTATAVAIPLGVWGSHMLCRYMAFFLNFDINSFAIPLWVFAVAAGAGIAVPLVACAIPVWRAVAMPVRRALASAGTPSETFGMGRFERMLAGVRGSVRPLLLAMRNSFRRRTRFVLTCMTLACGAMFFMAALDLRTSMSKTFDRLFAADRYDLTLDLEKMYRVDDVDRALRGTPGVIASENWIDTEGRVSEQPGSDQVPATSSSPTGSKPHLERLPGNRFSVVAIPLDSKLFVPVMAQGRGLNSGDTNSIVLNPTMAAQNPQIRVGDQVQLLIGSVTKTWRVVGICRQPMVPPPIGYIPISALDGVPAGMTNLVQVALAAPERASLELARERIDPRLESEGIHVSGGRSTAEYRTAVFEHVLMIYVFLVLASCIVAGVGGLGLMTTMGINVLERRREIGILRAIGATPRMIAAIILGESVTIALVGWAAAVMLAFLITKLLTAMIGGLLHSQFDFNIAPVGIVVSLGASVAIASLASVVAARSAMRLSVREALAYE